MTSDRTRIAILGSTGSIGRQAIEVVETHPDRFEIVALVAGSDERTLRSQGRRLNVDSLGLGEEAAVTAARRDDVDVVLNAVVGAAGLKASLAALGSGKRLALANKESLIAGGELCLAAARSGGGTILPVDSEHAALAQCLEGRERSGVEKVVLTASGGPFRTRKDLSNVTPDEALAHPTWAMGRKITIDSATLMNKGFEVIEAHFLFDLPYEQIETVVHPQSFVHAMAILVDGSMILQAGPADMRIPIAAALGSPERVGPAFARIEPPDIPSLAFEDVDRARFPAIDLAYSSGRTGGTAPAVLNAANEICVASFLDRDLGFNEIVRVVSDVLDEHDPEDASDLGSVLRADAWARERARALGAERTRSRVGS